MEIMPEEKPHNRPERRKDDIRIEHRFTSLEKDRDFIMERHKEVLGRLDGLGKYLKKMKDDVCGSVNEISNRVSDALVKIGVNELAIGKINERPQKKWEWWKRKLSTMAWIVTITAGMAATAYYIFRMSGGG